MATLGGKREGAGKPKGYKAPHTLEAQEVRKALVQRVREQLEPLLVAKLDLALGHYKEKVLDDGRTAIVYRQSPDGNALQYLLNQVIGKPKESIEIDNPKEVEEVRKLNDKIDSMIENVKHTRK